MIFDKVPMRSLICLLCKSCWGWANPKEPVGTLGKCPKCHQKAGVEAMLVVTKAPPPFMGLCMETWIPNATTRAIVDEYNAFNFS